MLDSLLQDVGFALRSCRRNPGFTLLVVLTLALGIGANTAVFGLVNGVLLKPLRFSQPERLVAVWETSPAEGVDKSPTSAGTFLDWRQQNQTLQGLTAWAWNTFILREEPEAVVLNGVFVEPNFFSVFGTDLLFGRTFASDDAEPGRRSEVVVVSHGLWQRRWGGASDVLGKVVNIDGSPVTIIGVMKPNLAAPDVNADLWVPVKFQSSVRWERYSRRLQAVGRLKPEATVQQAQQDFSRIASLLAGGEYQDIYQGWDARVIPLKEEVVGESRAALWIALAAVGLVLLIACVNVSNLLLSRAAVREREIAMRAVLGAGRWRLARQLLTESVLLAVGGGLLGVGFAWGIHRLLLTYQPGNLPRAEELALDGAALTFAFGLSVATGLLFGLAPLFHGFALNLQKSLQEATSRAAAGRSWARDTLVVAQLALTLVLMCAAGLLIRTLLELGSVNPGFQTEGAVAARVFLDNRRYDSQEKIRVYFRSLLERFRQMPAVRSAGGGTALPMDPLGINYDLPYRLEGQGGVPTNELPQADFRVVTPGYFEALGIPLRQGRLFEAADGPDSPRVVLVNETMAGQVWPGRSPVGQRVETPSTDWAWFEVAGVVADTRYYGLGSTPRPEMYVVLDQEPRRNLALVVDSSQPVAQTIDAVRREILAADPGQPAHSVVALSSLVQESIAEERFHALVLGALAAAALALSAAGIFGVVSYWVNQRRREFGIRMAVGAGGWDILRLVLRYGLLLAAVGGAIGLPAALLSTRVLTEALFQVQPADPLTYGAALGFLAVLALLAALLPALRASRVDPAGALRAE